MRHTTLRSAASRSKDPNVERSQRSEAPVVNGTLLFQFGPPFAVASVVSLCVMFGPPLLQLARLPRERVALRGGEMLKMIYLVRCTE